MVTSILSTAPSLLLAASNAGLATNAEVAAISVVQPETMYLRSSERVVSPILPSVSRRTVEDALRMFPFKIVKNVDLVGPDAAAGFMNARLFLEGHLRYPRLISLYGLLSRGLTGSVQVVDNAPGQIPDVALLLASMGASVIVKDPSEHISLHQHFVRRRASELLQRQIRYVDTLTKIDQPTPSDIVFWTNPNHDLIKPKSMSLGDYLGRDVAPGGYLVVQTDHTDNEIEDPRQFYLHNTFDPMRWETIYSGSMLDHRGDSSNLVLPTIQQGKWRMFLQIYRRIV